MSKSTAEIERDAEATRAELSSTLDELRRRIEPGQLMDQVFSYARNNGGSDFVRNAGAQARDNPLPILLIGAGLAWLASGRTPSSSGPSAGAIRDAAMRRTHDARDAGTGVLGAVSEAASSVVGSVRDATASGKAGVGNVGSTVGDMGSSAADSLRSGGAAAQDAMGRVQAMFADNPVALGALGVAIGAAIGAALPTTETENRLIGEKADDLKSAARDKVDEQIERGKKAVSAGLEEAKRQDGEVKTEDGPDLKKPA